MRSAAASAAGAAGAGRGRLRPRPRVPAHPQRAGPGVQPSRRAARAQVAPPPRARQRDRPPRLARHGLGGHGLARVALRDLGTGPARLRSRRRTSPPLRRSATSRRTSANGRPPARAGRGPRRKARRNDPCTAVPARSTRSVTAADAARSTIGVRSLAIIAWSPESRPQACSATGRSESGSAARWTSRGPSMRSSCSARPSTTGAPRRSSRPAWTTPWTSTGTGSRPS